MFSALKKLVGSEQAPGRDRHIPAGLQSMNQALQRRFAKGGQDSMKIVIRGDRNTGKTALWHRLQGRPFVEEYIPTQEIQVTSIHWSYKTTDDIVKVEVWDVVDKGKCKKRGDGLKMENDPQEAESKLALDAEFLDVYKNCNGVVMMFDITKQWTFNYVLRELPKVPTHVPVCVLGNYRDMGEHRVILPDDVRDFIDSLDRPPGSSYSRYAESSMKNSFGLKYLHKFFNIPFLQLQRETLLRQLETNQLDTDATLEELSVQQETEDQNYGIFLEMMEARSRGLASPLTANGQSPSSGSQSPVVPPSAVSTGSSSPGTPQPALQPPLSTPLTGPPLPSVSPAPAKVRTVEDFVPEDRLDHSFLEDATLLKDKQKAGVRASQQDSDSDGEAPGGNPMVASLQDDVDLEDQPGSRVLLPAGPPPRGSFTPGSEVGPERQAQRPGVAALASPLSTEPETEGTSVKTSGPRGGAGAKAHPQLDSLPPSVGPERPDGTRPLSKCTSPRTEGRDKPVSSSDSDPEGPIAAQMLSFVMDDPDFESGESDTQRRVGEFPVREDVSDLTDEDAGPAALPPPPPPHKGAGPSFRLKSDSDLFGLGLGEPGPKDSSEEGKDDKPPSKEKEKKKKKKKAKEEGKAVKKKSRHRKSKDAEEDTEERRRRRPRGTGPKAMDELEAFLGGAPTGTRHPGGGDYEEL
ncbi:Putative GTP-binding protein Parf [Tupaia chinensis]|uniref:Rab-like protein 6 n=1 Tax=Tupaia chinensis TaxID=246437 RepID=L8YDI2_TUPCH|nr:Putative GTP-binding protein Parf [Tupaia chinensis]